MTALRGDAIGQLAGGLIVSCQALPGDPLDRIEDLVALARSAEIGGAVAVRVAGVDVVAAVRRACSVPVIGITKHPDRTRAYVTPHLADARALAKAGADIVAVDATDRERPDGLTAADYIRLVRDELGIFVMADVSTEGEGLRAFDAGADLVATTLAGYTAYSRPIKGPDLDLISRLSAAGRLVAEGRVSTPEQLAACFDAGAYAVVVGRAITRPQDITARFVASTPRARGAPPTSDSGARSSAGPPRMGAPVPAAGKGGPGYWLGVDGGMSALRSVVLRSDGVVHGTGSAEPPGPLLAPHGREELRASLRAAIAEAMGATAVPLRGAFLGLSGVVAGGRLEQAAREAAAGVVQAERLFVDTDIYAAWAGALTLQPGLVAVAGTGSGVLGVDQLGRCARAGGWGYLFGDEAGGFGIAREAIRLALRLLDGGALPADLARLLVEHFGVHTVAEIPKAFYAGEIDRKRVAELAPRLADAATKDGALADLLGDAARVLATQLAQVAGRLAWEHGRVEWAAVGGLFRSGVISVDEIARHLATPSGIEFVAVAPRFPPAVGAALLAAKMADGPEPAAIAASGLQQGDRVGPEAVART